MSWAKEKFIYKTIIKYCKQNNIEFKEYSDSWVIELVLKNKSYFIFGPDLGLNSSSLADLVTDKSALFEVLESIGVPAIKHFLLLRPGSPSYDENLHGIAKAKSILKKYRPVILKPNAGFAGYDVLKADTEKELEEKLEYLFNRHRAVAISPFEEIENEYRLTILSGKIVYVYKKYKNESYSFNLTQGAKATVASTKDIEDFIPNIDKVFKKIPICFVNLDLALTKEGLKIMEINKGVAFEKYLEQNPKEEKNIEKIYFKALQMIEKNC